MNTLSIWAGDDPNDISVDYKKLSKIRSIKDYDTIINIKNISRNDLSYILSLMDIDSKKYLLNKINKDKISIKELLNIVNYLYELQIPSLINNILTILPFYNFYEIFFQNISKFPEDFINRFNKLTNPKITTSLFYTEDKKINNYKIKLNISEDDKKIIISGCNNAMYYNLDNNKEIILKNVNVIFSEFSKNNKYILYRDIEGNVYVNYNNIIENLKDFYSISLFSPKNDRILCVNLGGELLLYDLLNFSLIYKFSQDKENINIINNAKFSPNGELIMYSLNNILIIINTYSGEEIFSNIHENNILSCEFSNNSDKIAYTTEQNIIIIDLVENKSFNNIIGYEINNILFSPNDNYCLFYYGNSIHIYNVNKGIEQFKINYGYITNAVFSPLEEFLITGYKDGVVIITDISNEENYFIKYIDNENGNFGMDFSSDGTMLVLSFSKSKKVTVYETLFYSEIFHVLNDNNVVDVKFSKKGNFIAVISDDCKVKIVYIN
uniref:Uncharacterized protein n=1 Tax=Pithovirus LCPAC104 TaxID=2506589 RepID=A0A481Z715_9VIRU|nr:MAG: hypothetical protein LCPAC104_00170 [Pithovirus LCPAC104]